MIVKGTGTETNQYPKCKETNDSTSQFCRRCGSALSLKILLKLEEERGKFDGFMKEFLVKLSERDDGVKEILGQMVKERGLESLFGGS